MKFSAYNDRLNKYVKLVLRGDSMKIILASASPRRKEILENAGLKFKVVKSDIEETVFEDETPEELVKRLSHEKAAYIADKNRAELVIGSDTVVAIDGKILGKPADEKEAYNMLKMLSGRDHYVTTGVSMINREKGIDVTNHCTSSVKFKNLSDSDIYDYISTGEFKDKAGSYGIQGFGAVLVEYIKGDYFNIVGFPISMASDMMKESFGINIFTGSGLSE